MIKNLIVEIDARFTSGNSVPVERATIKASEWKVMREWIIEACSILNEAAECDVPLWDCRLADEIKEFLDHGVESDPLP